MDVMPLVLTPGGKDSFEGEYADGFAISNEAVRSISAFFQDTFRFSWANETQLKREARKRIPAVQEMYNGNVAKYAEHREAYKGVYITVLVVCLLVSCALMV